MGKAASFDKERILAQIEFERAWNMMPDQQATCCPFANKAHQTQLAHLRQVAAFAAHGSGVATRHAAEDVEAPSKPVSRGLTREDLAHFEEHGYVIARGILSDEMITSI